MRTNSALIFAPPDVALKIAVLTSAGCYQKWSVLLTLEPAILVPHGAGSLVHCGGGRLVRPNGGVGCGRIIFLLASKDRVTPGDTLGPQSAWDIRW